MSDEPRYTPQSGRELTLTLRGMLERIKDGDQAAETNLKLLLNALVGPGREALEERCPEAVLRIRMALLKLGQDCELKEIDQRLAAERLAIEKARAAKEAGQTELPGAKWGSDIAADADD